MNSPSRQFQFSFIYDGTSTSIDINLMSGPICYATPTNVVGGSVVFNPRFDDVPSDVVGLHLSGSSNSVTKTSLTRWVLSLSFSNSGMTSGNEFTIYGTLVY